MPGYQGEYDGLCGMYAISNAYEICGYDLPEEEIEEELGDIFKICCSALAESRWPDILWDGTSFGDMRKMISTCQDHYEFRIKVTYPFLRNSPKTNEDYWEKLADIFGKEDENVLCAIIGMEAPDPHWTVVEPSLGGHLFFSDSATGSIERVRIETIHAGKRKPVGKNYKFNPRELIVFSVEEEG